MLVTSDLACILSAPLSLFFSRLKSYHFLELKCTESASVWLTYEKLYINSQCQCDGMCDSSVSAMAQTVFLLKCDYTVEFKCLASVLLYCFKFQPVLRIARRMDATQLALTNVIDAMLDFS